MQALQRHLTSDSNICQDCSRFEFCCGLSISTWRCFILIFWVWRWRWHGVRFECSSHCSHVGTNSRCRVWWPRGSPGQRFMCGIFPNVFLGYYFSFNQVAKGPPIYWVLCALSMQHMHCFCLVYFFRSPQILGHLDPAFALKPPSVMASLTERQKACLHFFCFFFLGQGVN